MTYGHFVSGCFYLTLCLGVSFTSLAVERLLFNRYAVFHGMKISLCIYSLPVFLGFPESSCLYFGESTRPFLSGVYLGGSGASESLSLRVLSVVMV